jgi:hypothetical protein
MRYLIVDTDVNFDKHVKEQMSPRAAVYRLVSTRNGSDVADCSLDAQMMARAQVEDGG